MDYMKIMKWAEKWISPVFLVCNVFVGQGIGKTARKVSLSHPCLCAPQVLAKTKIWEQYSQMLAGKAREHDNKSTALCQADSPESLEFPIRANQATKLSNLHADFRHVEPKVAHFQPPPKEQPNFSARQSAACNEYRKQALYICMVPTFLSTVGDREPRSIPTKDLPHPVVFWGGWCANCRSLRERQNAHHTPNFALAMLIVHFVGMVRGFRDLTTGSGARAIDARNSWLWNGSDAAKPVFALPGCQRTSVNTLLCDTLGLALMVPEGPAIEKIQSRLIAWNFQSIRLKVSIQDWKFQSRLKVSISLENFNPDLDNSPQQEPYFQSRLKISISIDNFNLRLVAWKFQSRSEILNLFNLWALWGARISRSDNCIWLNAVISRAGGSRQSSPPSLRRMRWVVKGCGDTKLQTTDRTLPIACLSA